MTRHATTIIGIRHCGRCDRDLPDTQFTPSNSWCRECRSEYCKQHYHKQAAAGAFRTRPCAVCDKACRMRSFKPRDDTVCQMCRRMERRLQTMPVRPSRPPRPPLPPPPPPPAPEPVRTWTKHAVTRNPNRIPVLYGCQANGDHACYISDGVTTGPTRRHVVDAIAAWNAL